MRRDGTAHAFTLAVACFIVALICFALILSGCSQSATGRALNAGVVVAASADHLSTRAALERGAVEVNPILGRGAWRHGLIKGASVSAVIGLAWGVELKGRPVLAHVCRAIAVGLYTAATIHNLRQEGAQ